MAYEPPRGTGGSTCPEWMDGFHPKGLPNRSVRCQYGKRLLLVEINDTYHRMPKASVRKACTAEVPVDSKFVLGFSKQFTHHPRHEGMPDSKSPRRDVAGVLKKRLGPSRHPLPRCFEKDMPQLRGFPALRPKSIAV